MALYAQLQEDYKNAFKAKDTISKEILNFVLAGLKNKQIEIQKELSDDEVIKVLKKEIKTREESIVYLEKAHDRLGVQTEQAKIQALERYLPATMSEEQVKSIVEAQIASLGITDIQKEKGKLIWTIMKEHGANIDGWVLNKVISNLQNA